MRTEQAAAVERAWEYRRGFIEVLDTPRGRLRCSQCGAEWWPNIRPNSGGRYYRGSWTCYRCGANSKGGFAKQRGR